MEQIGLRPWAEKTVTAVKHVGEFVLERLKGGGWAEFNHPNPANIQVKEAQIDKGEN